MAFNLFYFIKSWIFIKRTHLIWIFVLIATAIIVLLSCSKQNDPAKIEGTAPSISPSPATPVSDVPASSTKGPVVKTYEDTPLSAIVADIARAYSKLQAYRTQKAASLRLYFRLDTRRGLEKNIEELNTFENINIEINGDTLVVD